MGNVQCISPWWSCNSMYIPCVQGSCIYGGVQNCGWHCVDGNIIITCMWQGCVHINCMMYMYSFQRVTQHMDPHTLIGSLWTLPSSGPSSFCLLPPYWWSSWWTKSLLLCVCLEDHTWSVPTSAWDPHKHTQYTRTTPNLQNTRG